ncbi:2,4'-dihydroxyacetophenone dioxygenase family protein [Pseudomonas sp. UL073]|uniref:2,4'-dihydroxyacetophenone dioxygenase family protein n=1 Tax=Zestomonas insulae TaxID=2809017 RepID=A0ABS2IFI0_9GAMM|nr:2,4'-dihydroxyacetophenone dioxygenase family protein [Pseudomonas insulae]MBM7061841.1 2,4'-dihydroxyacetophenone dioxygenase family protein [Pseudomonas insulae]
MALPDAFTHQDELLTISTNANPFLKGLLHPGINVAPLFLDPYNGVWVLRVKFAPGVTLPLHFHTGTVHFYTMSGCWYYSEYPDQKQTAGCYLYEPGGSVHQLNTPADNTEDTDTFMIVSGANVNFSAEGEYLNMMDASLIKSWVDEAIDKQEGAQDVRYIHTPIPTYTQAKRNK